MDRKAHCMKCVQIRSYFWSVFSRIRTEYREILRILQLRENTDQKKLRIWTLSMQWLELDLTMEMIQKPCLLGLARILHKVLNMKCEEWKQIKRKPLHLRYMVVFRC